MAGPAPPAHAHPAGPMARPVKIRPMLTRRSFSLLPLACATLYGQDRSAEKSEGVSERDNETESGLRLPLGRERWSPEATLFARNIFGVTSN